MFCELSCLSLMLWSIESMNCASHRGFKLGTIPSCLDVLISAKYLLVDQPVNLCGTYYGTIMDG